MTPTARRRTGVALVVAATALAVWAVMLAVTLGPGEHRSHWVVLDTLEVVGLAGTGVALLHGRRWRAALAALLTAPLLGYDVLMDVVSAHGSSAAMAQALALGLVEVPAGAALLWIAYCCSRSRAAFA